MTEDTQIDKALKDLEDGKFSFQMVDRINQCIATQQAELETLRGFRAEATTALDQQEAKVARLERDLRIANATILRLIRTNALLEEGVAATKYGVAKFGEVAVPKIRQAAFEAKPYAVEAFKYTWTKTLKAMEAVAPQVREWWVGVEPRLKEMTKAASQSSPKGQN